ncbi:hypothetical protein F7R20_09365 [Pseudomonas brassicacearum subsp. brassicacearum]|nr:hypothetical protein F7R20_09365 [Pseudomonas brassicacearum subsp. brassicacearum]PJH86874.1 hypothetical protein CVG87_23125 [Pseudomonas sp. WCS365]QEO80604.1 hypothetical protein ELZ14_24780 [Pseudomonas brassicacearum]
MGASLLAKATAQSASPSTEPPLSRASSLPHWFSAGPQDQCTPQCPCGSELARDGDGTVSISSN